MARRPAVRCTQPDLSPYADFLQNSDEGAFEVGKKLALSEGAVIFENELIQVIEPAPGRYVKVKAEYSDGPLSRTLLKPYIIA